MTTTSPAVDLRARAICISVAVALSLVGIERAYGQPLNFNFIAADTTLMYQQATGEGQGTVSIYIAESVSPGFPHIVAGWSMSLSNDPAVLAVSQVNEGDYMTSVIMPAFWGTELYPDGFTLGCVYSILGGTQCTYEVPKEVAVITYVVADAGLAADPDGTTTTLHWTPVGTPTGLNGVVVGGALIPATTFDATLQLIGASLFLRGDANNDGSLTAIPDAIAMLIHLFGLAAPLACLDSGDWNDDGLIDVSDPIGLLTWGFAGGPPPPAPVDGCGEDPTSDSIDCAAPLCP